MKLLIATTNPAKYDELTLFLRPLGVPFVSLRDLGITDSVEETGKTFEENAIIKAQYYARKSSLPAIADDGGFEIDALSGMPGVRSHRWISGTKEDSDEDLIAYTIERMKNIPIDRRGAQLRLVLAFAMPSGRAVTAEAAIRGIVAEKPSDHRTPGFPYRSLLYLPDLSKFYDHSQLTPKETDTLNHRKIAVQKLIPEIRKLLTISGVPLQ